MWYPRLIYALFRFVCCVYFILNYQDVKSSLIPYISELGYYILATLITYHFFSAILTLRAGGNRIPIFEKQHLWDRGVGNSEEYNSRLGQVYAYRETLMKGMGTDEAAKLYVGSDISPLLNGGKRSKEVLNYVETRLSGMGLDDGLQFLKDLKSK